MAVTQLNTVPYGQLTPISIVITTTGVTNYGVFGVAGSPVNRDRTLTLVATGATALPTTLTLDLECSSDGGTTWGKYGANTSIALVATTAFTAKIITNVVSGLLYRINPTTYTAGSSTGTTVWGVLN